MLFWVLAFHQCSPGSIRAFSAMSQTCCLSTLLLESFPSGWPDLPSSENPSSDLFWFQVSPIWRSRAFCLARSTYTFQLRADKIELVESKLEMSTLSNQWHLLKQEKRCLVGDFRSKPLVDRIFTSHCFSENWHSSNRPELFPTLSRREIGETAQTRLHYTHSSMDFPTVFQGNYSKAH